MRISGRIACRFACAAAIAVAASTSVQAAPITIGLVTDAGAYYGTTVEGTPVAGSETFTAARLGYGYDTDPNDPRFICDWSVTFDSDPFYLANFNITNTTLSTQTFTLTVTLPVSPAFSGPSVIGGYFGLLRYFDQNSSSSVTINSVGTTLFFTAGIDNSPVQGIGSFTATASGGPMISGTVNQQEFGTPIPSQPYPGGVSTNITGSVRFELTAGDRTTFPIYFEVQPVPEPATALLIGLGVAGLALVRQRRAR